MFAKTIAVRQGFCNNGLCQGGFPLNPCATRLHAEALREAPAGGWTWAMPTVKKEKTRMARPMKSNDEKLNHTVAFRLTDGDFLDYKRKFSASGLNQSEFFREHVLTNTTQVVARRVVSADARRAVFLLQKASNNVNQLAHRANSEHLAGVLSEGTVLAIVDQLRQLNRCMLEQTRQATE